MVILTTDFNSQPALALSRDRKFSTRENQIPHDLCALVLLLVIYRLRVVKCKDWRAKNTKASMFEHPLAAGA